MPLTMQSSGDSALDRELDYLASLLKSIQPQAVQPVQNLPPAFVPIPQIEVKTSDGLYDSFVDGLEFDQLAGYYLSDSGDLSKVSRTPSVVTPAAQSVAGTAGTSVASANDDHAHAPVVTTKGDIMGYSTLPVRVAVSGTNNNIPLEDSTQAAGWRWGAPSATAVQHPPFWRVRAYQASVGSNLVLDGSWFDYR